MKNLVLCITLIFLFFINTVYSGSVEVGAIQEQIKFQKDSPFTLKCNVSYVGEQQPTIQWFKDNKNISDIKGLKDKATTQWDENNTNILTVTKADDNSAGNYTCVAYQGTEEKARANFTAAVTKAAAVKVPSNINVVEEERLRIECQVAGDVRLVWKFGNETYDVSRDRVILEDYTDKDEKLIKNGRFIIDKVNNDDVGYVTCVGLNLITGNVSTEDSCRVRIRGKYAALWPFLGICAEVIVLCAIIVIYEKKRNKTELEESDTDQSPDQKNTPDHGKEANLRHRQ